MLSIWCEVMCEVLQQNPVALCLCLVTILYFCIRPAWAAWTRVEASKASGCQTCCKYLPWDITGWRFAKQMAEAERAGNVNGFIGHCYNTVGSRTFAGRKGGRKTFYTIDPIVCQAVLATSFDDFGVEPFRGSTRDSFIGRGVLTTDGEFWKRSREGLKPVFERAQVANLDQFGKHVDRLLEHIPLNETTIELQPLIERFFLDVSSEFLLGESANSLAQSDSIIDAADFIKSFNEALAGVGKRLARGRFNRLYEPFGREKKWVDACNRTRDLVDKYVDRALDGKMNSSEEQQFNFIRILAEDTTHREFIRDQVVNVFFPARNSSNRAFNNILFLLARSPQSWMKLREEALQQEAHSLTYDSLKSLKYVKWVINEGLRLYASSPRTVRVALCDTILPRGGGQAGESPTYVEKGSMVVMDTASMHRDKEFWGEDAEQFRPERWQHARPKWEYLPFAGGPRICPAQNMMLTQYAYLLITLARRFSKLENRDPEERFIEAWSGIGISSRNGVKVAFIV